MGHTRNNVIVALDFDEQAKALALVNQLDPRLCRLKVGITMYTKLGPDFVKLLVNKGFDVFLDLKFHDIPQQVFGACQSAASLGVWMMNVHALGGLSMMQNAVEALKPFGDLRPLLIGVTVLTSMQQKDMTEIGLQGDVSSNVVKLAGLCKQAGLDGVVCSAQEASMIKQEYGPEFITVTPGIRFADDSAHDQKRIMTPEMAIANGADYLVMGRSITQHERPNEVLQQLRQVEVL